MKKNLFLLQAITLCTLLTGSAVYAGDARYVASLTGEDAISTVITSEIAVESFITNETVSEEDTTNVELTPLIATTLSKNITSTFVLFINFINVGRARIHAGIASALTNENEPSTIIIQ